MKKTSLLVALPFLAFSGLLLTGCGLFRSHKAWDTAQQQSPLEIPPNMDRPEATAALAIPPEGGNQPTSNGAVANFNGGPSGGLITDGFLVPGNVDDAYQRVALALQDGSLGQVASHDDASRSYIVNVPASIAQRKKRGFFGRIFHHDKTVADASAASGGLHPVQISIDSSGTTASEVRVQGKDAASVIKVVDTLKPRVSKVPKAK